MRWIAEIIKNPLTFSLLLLVIASIMSKLKRKKTGRWLTILAVVYLLVTSIPIYTRPFVVQLEKQWPPLTQIPDSLRNQPVNILVLGGGHTFSNIIPPLGQLNNISLGRLMEGIRLYKTLPGSRLILSGYKADQPNSHASALFLAAVEIGCDSTRLDTIPEPHNTHAEAHYYSRRFPKTTPLILVTDAIHMPRAVRFFRLHGINPIPAPANYIVKSDKIDIRTFLIPSGYTLFNTERILHEYIGLGWQALGGK